MLGPSSRAASAMGDITSELAIASVASLANVPPEPELLAIDREIGLPYRRDPIVYNSQAWSRRLELPWAVQQLGPVDGLRILDVGSGASALPVLLARRGARVTSVDPVPRRTGPWTNPALVKAGLPRLPFRDEAFDAVVCISVLEHLDLSLAACLREFFRLARRRVVLTFDLALGPLSFVGLSTWELRALARMVGPPVRLPPDPLVPTGGERAGLGHQLGVALLSMTRESGRWPELRLPPLARPLVRLHRLSQVPGPSLTARRLVVQWMERHGCGAM